MEIAFLSSTSILPFRDAYYFFTLLENGSWSTTGRCEKRFGRIADYAAYLQGIWHGF